MSRHRLIPRILLCLALGLIITVAIAWTSAWFPFSADARFKITQNATFIAGSLIYERCHQVTGDGETWSILCTSTDSPVWWADAIARIRAPWWWPIDPARLAGTASNAHVAQTMDARGWPVRALRCAWRGTRGSIAGPSIGGIDLPPPPDGKAPTLATIRALPCRPIWRGLAADTLLFALAWSALLFVPPAIRTHLRIRRGLCPHCAYNLADLQPDSLCPECGHARAPKSTKPGPKWSGVLRRTMNLRRPISWLLLRLTCGLLTTVAIAWTSAAWVILEDDNELQQSWVMDADGKTAVAMILRLHRFASDRRILCALGARDVMYSSLDELHAADVASASMFLSHLPQGDDFPAPWASMPNPADLPSTSFGIGPWTQDARGWPMLALACDWIGEPSSNGHTLSSPPPRGGIELSPTGMFQTLRALPYRPIWPGLFADTLLFAVAWSALLFAPRAIRTHLRRRRNLCPACAYNLRGLPPQSRCPECGQASRA